MNDSKDLNEKKGEVVANTPYEEEVKGMTQLLLKMKMTLVRLRILRQRIRAVRKLQM